jgi:STE24 endopeptidase
VEIQRCPHCHFRIFPSREGICPSCSLNVHDEPAPRHLEFVVEKNIADTEQYHRRAVRCTITVLFLQIACVAFAVLAGPSIDAWLEHGLGIHFAGIRCWIIVLMTLSFLVGVCCPLDYYAGFVLERRYGMSKQPAGRWLSLYLSNTAKVVMWRSLILTGLYLFICTNGARWWLWSTVVALVWNIWRTNMTPTRFGPNGSRIKPVGDADVVHKVSELLTGSGLHVEEISQICAGEDSIRPNAYLLGMGNARRLLLTDSLLKGFEPGEVEVVLAHEVGHVVHHHVPKLLMINGLRNCIGFYLCDIVFRWGLSLPDVPFSYRDLPAYLITFYFLVMTVWMLISLPIVAGINRYFERQCDQYALARADSIADYRSAMGKLAHFNRIPLTLHPIEIALLHDHPAMSERIAMAEMRVDTFTGGLSR